MVIGLIPVGMIETHAYELKIPERVRPTRETVWNHEHIGNTFSSNTENSFFITETNTVKGYGNNYYGQLGIGVKGSSVTDKTNENQLTDVLGENGVGLLTNIVAVANNTRQVFALDTNGDVWGWGDVAKVVNSDGSTKLYGTRTTPIKMEGFSDIISIKPTAKGLVALKEDGSVWYIGDLYIQSATTTGVAKQIPGFSDIVQIASVSFGVFALKGDGSVWVVGLDKGVNPIKIESLNDIVKVAAGYRSIIALKRDGTVYATYATSATNKLDKDFIQVEYDNDVSYVADIVDIAGHTEVNSGGFSLITKDNRMLRYKISGAIATTLVEERDITNNTYFSNNSFVFDTLSMLIGFGNGNFMYRSGSSATFDRTFAISGIKEVTTIPEHMLYKFNSPREREFYEGGKVLPIEFELISDSVDSFDIYYGPYEGWTDEGTWIPIEKNVPISRLNPTPYISEISDGNGGYLEGTRYTYGWTMPNEFIPHIRIITVPSYK